jgi:hypothetical protein
LKAEEIAERSKQNGRELIERQVVEEGATRKTIVVVVVVEVLIKT